MDNERKRDESAPLDWDTPEYRELVRKMKRARQQNRAIDQLATESGAERSERYQRGRQ